MAHMNATIGPRRLDLLGDRIEAACASHKIAGRVWGGTVSDSDMLFTLTTAHGMIGGNKLIMLRDEIELSLGLPVTIERAEASLLVRVGREWPARPPVQPAPAIPEPSLWPTKIALALTAVTFLAETALCIHGLLWLIGVTP